MKYILKFSPLLFLAIIAGVLCWHTSGGINDLTFWVLTMTNIVLTTTVGIYRSVNDRRTRDSNLPAAHDSDMVTLNTSNEGYT